MDFNSLNLLEKLEGIKQKSNDAIIMTEVYDILNQVDKKRNQIKQNISKPSNLISNQFNFDYLETKHIFHISQIKTLCIDYRLRFLDASKFKGHIPEEALSIIRNLEHTHQTTLQGFKIIAPSKLLRLETYDDPILLAPIGNGYFYFIHKWGNDMSIFRKWFMKPFKNMVNFLLFLIFASLVFTVMSPSMAGSANKQAMMQFIIFLFTFKSFVGIALYYGIAYGKNFSEEVWRSEYIH